MKTGIDASWITLQKACEGEPLLRFREDRYEQYAKAFEDHYKNIKENFMSEDTESLDIHKQAAIIMISALEAQVFEQTPPGPGKIPVGPYMAALNVALSYLEDHIKRVMKCVDSDKEAELLFPIAFACDTHYFEIMRRMLLYEDPNPGPGNPGYALGYNILEWADRFYLLEYITVLASGINPSVYKSAAQSLPAPEKESASPQA